jgi:hypothetical protein
MSIDSVSAEEALFSLEHNPGLVPIDPDAMFSLTYRATGSRAAAREAKIRQTMLLSKDS